MPSPITVIVADDHAVLRAGLRSLLESERDIEVVGEAATGEEAIDLAREIEPVVVVMDLSMPGMGGLVATREIRSSGLVTEVLVLTMHPENEVLEPILDAGAKGYLPKTSADRDLVTALRAVARGEAYLPPGATGLLVDRFTAGARKENANGLDRLSRRERQVLALTAEGFTSTEIGERLEISPKTVDTYRSRIMQKLALEHRSELVRFALRTGLLRAEA